MNSTYILLLLFILGSSNGQKVGNGSNCSKSFRTNCTCGFTHVPFWKPMELLYVVNCSDAGFKSSEILEELDGDTQVLIFTGNRLLELPWNIFGFPNLSGNLELIDMSRNGIQDISGKTFRQVGSVRRLVLSHNNLQITGSYFHPRIMGRFYRLEELELRNAFSERDETDSVLRSLKNVFLASSLKKLKRLSLEENDIWRLQDVNLFCTLPSLEELYLSENQLQSVNIAPNCLSGLQVLDLRFNRIQRLSRETLKKLTFRGNNRTKILLRGNPFVCDCNLQPFLDWISGPFGQLVDGESLRCASGWPLSNTGRRLMSLSRLECAPSSPCNESNSVFMEVLLGMVFLALGCLSFAFIWVNRRAFNRGALPNVRYNNITRSEENQAFQLNI